MRRRISAAVISLSGLLLASGLSGQLSVASPVQSSVLDIGVERPFLDNANGLAFYSSIVRVGARFPVRDDAVLSLEAPLSIVDGDRERSASIALGNLRADLVIGRVDGLRGFIGVTGLTATELRGGFSSQVLGLISGLDQLEVWPTDVFSLHAGLLPAARVNPATTVGARLGFASVWSGEEDDAEIYSRFGAWIRMERGSVRLDGEVLGSHVHGEGDGFGSSSVFYLDWAATWVESAGQPGVFIRLPLDGDARRSLNLSIGVQLAIGS